MTKTTHTFWIVAILSTFVFQVQTVFGSIVSDLSTLSPFSVGTDTGGTTSSSSLVVTPMGDTTSFAQSLVGPGITISNVKYTGADSASGYFSGGYATGNDISSGLILTTGSASAAANPVNTSDKTSYNNHLAGNAQLDSLVPNYKTYDATVLSFDFTSSGDAAYFNYSFASEEYTEWVNSSYNDVFGFFVNGENYALIPETSTAVSINNISDKTNSQFFNNNDPSQTNSPYPFEYDGFTDVFTAAITGLTPGETYNIEIAIADAGDSIYDSAVFLEKGTFSSAPVAPTPSAAPEPSVTILLVLMSAGLVSAFYRFRHSVMGNCV